MVENNSALSSTDPWVALNGWTMGPSQGAGLQLPILLFIICHHYMILC